MARSRRSSVSAGQLELAGFAAAPPEAAAAEKLEPTALGREFARLMERIEGAPSPLVAQAAEGVSVWCSAGHSCVPLAALGLASARSELLATKVVGEPGTARPLILDASGRLYLHRYWSCEEKLAGELLRRAAAPPPAVDRDLLERDLQQWLPAATPDREAGQRDAARTALLSSFCAIVGGPGTGKTRTVAIVLALLASQSATPPRVLLAAPTGKAALRLTESIRGVLRETQAGPAFAKLEGVTLHRLLGMSPHSARPRWDEAHRLAADAVIVDEASMVDLPMMARLCAAAPLSARLILLGDRDQLASVETGHVLGDICKAGQGRLRGSICELKENFRFGSGSLLQQMSVLVNRGASEELLELLSSPADGPPAGAPLPLPTALADRLAGPAVEGYRAALTAPTPEVALQALGRYRILGALQAGPYGVANLNRLAESALAAARLIFPDTRNYAGRAIMIVRNDHTLRLFNGDIGLLLPDGRGELRAFFPGDAGPARSFPISRLPEHETAWAMTVHKSQGSEFDRLLLVLPDRETPVLTRELIYTAITRARSEAQLWYEPSVLKRALQRTVQRSGGLAEKLA